MTRTLCNGDHDLPLKFEFFTYRESGHHIDQGSIILSVNQILTNPVESLVGSRSALLRISSSRIIQKPSFMDFLQGGWVLNLNCAIDFTSSNGEITDPKSLHYQHP